MSSVPILSATGRAGKELELPEALFGSPVPGTLLHQAVLHQLGGRHFGSADTRTRGEVRGGGAKPWRQKGTGRARQGSRRAPQWTGGGVVFGPHPHRPEAKLNAKVRRAALKGALTARAAEGAVRVVTGFGLDEITTRGLLERLSAWKAQGRVLLVLAGRDPIVERSCRNLREVRIVLADSLNVVDLLQADTLVFTADAVDRARQVYA